MKNWWLLLVGFFAGLWWSERQRNEALTKGSTVSETSSQKSRTLEELSPTYAANPHPLKEISGIQGDHLYTYAHNLAQEMIRPDLTELEKKLAADFLGKTILDATMYHKHRKRKQDEQSESWLHDAIEEELDEDANER